MIDCFGEKCYLLFELSEFLFVSIVTPAYHPACVVTVRRKLAAEIIG